MGCGSSKKVETAVDLTEPNVKKLSTVTEPTPRLSNVTDWVYRSGHNLDASGDKSDSPGTAKSNQQQRTEASNNSLQSIKLQIYFNAYKKVAGASESIDLEQFRQVLGNLGWETSEANTSRVLNFMGMPECSSITLREYLDNIFNVPQTPRTGGRKSSADSSSSFKGGIRAVSIRDLQKAFSQFADSSTGLLKGTDVPAMLRMMDMDQIEDQPPVSAFSWDEFLSWVRVSRRLIVSNSGSTEVAKDSPQLT